jgi:hypothetical protein
MVQAARAPEIELDDADVRLHESVCDFVPGLAPMPQAPRPGSKSLPPLASGVRSLPPPPPSVRPASLPPPPAASNKPMFELPITKQPPKNQMARAIVRETVEAEKPEIVEDLKTRLMARVLPLIQNYLNGFKEAEKALVAKMDAAGTAVSTDKAEVQRALGENRTLAEGLIGRIATGEQSLLEATRIGSEQTQQTVEALTTCQSELEATRAALKQVRKELADSNEASKRREEELRQSLEAFKSDLEVSRRVLNTLSGKVSLMSPGIRKQSGRSPLVAFGIATLMAVAILCAFSFAQTGSPNPVALFDDSSGSKSNAVAGSLREQHLTSPAATSNAVPQTAPAAPIVAQTVPVAAPVPSSDIKPAAKKCIPALTAGIMQEDGMFIREKGGTRYTCSDRPGVTGPKGTELLCGCTESKI